MKLVAIIAAGCISFCVSSAQAQQVVCETLPPTIASPVIVETPSTNCPTCSPTALLSQLNAPLVPGLPAVPGMPTVSPLGILAPRLSVMSTFIESGGFANPNAGQMVLGIAAPRLAAASAICNGTVDPFTGLLGIAAPRLAVGVQLLKGGAFCR
jgi:hypothetical protein